MLQHDVPSPGRRPKWLWGAVGALVVVVLLVVVLGRGGDGGGIGIAAITEEPEELGDFDVDGLVQPVGRLDGLLVVESAPDEYSDKDTIVAIDIETGRDVWDEDGSAAVIAGKYVIIGNGDELRRYDRDGKPVGERLSVDGDVVRLFAESGHVVASTTTGNALINAQRWEVVSDDIGLGSADLQHVAETDIRGNDYRIQFIDPSTGEKIGDRVTLDSDVDDVRLTSDGRILVLDDDKLSLLGPNGDEITSIDVSRGSYSLNAAVGPLVAVNGDSDCTVYRLSGDRIEEVNPDLDGYCTLPEISGNTYVVSSSDGETTVSSIDADSIEELFDVRSSDWDLTDTGLYITDEEDLDYYPVPGEGKSSWTLSLDDNQSFVLLDGVVVIVEYDSYDVSTTLTVFG